MTKKSVGYRLPHDVVDRIKDLASRYDMTQGEVIETVVELTEDEVHNLDLVRLEIVTTDPLALSGKKWEGKFRGVVRIIFPPDCSVRTMDVYVDGMFFSEFVNMIHAQYEDVQRLFRSD